MPGNLNTSFITGLAGSGKSTGLKARLTFDPEAFMLCSTTGISAINMGVATLNSTLKYYDTDSLMDNYINGKLYNAVKRIVTGPNALHGLAIDEVSMMDAEQLDMIYDTFVKIARSKDVTEDLDLVLVGDFLQLAPVKAKFAFEAKCWPEFEKNTVKLDKVYRQDNMLFLEALNEFRAGNGRNGVDLLKKCGVKFNDKLVKFKGTTIVPKNEAVDNYNKVLFGEVNSALIQVKPLRIGIQSSDWKDPKIPDVLELKIGCLVMILANDTVYKTYANGDQGLLKGFDSETGEFIIEIVSSTSDRNGKVVKVGKVKREIKESVKDPMTGLMGVKKVIGSIEYVPLRLAYATSVHKCQGLSLDNVQLDFRDKFFGNPGMMYVALSRCRTPEGLRLVGSEEIMIKRTVVNPKVVRFL